MAIRRKWKGRPLGKPTFRKGMRPADRRRAQDDGGRGGESMLDLEREVDAMPEGCTRPCCGGRASVDQSERVS